MKKEYIITSFEEQAPKELLECGFYAKANKPLSFQCRGKNDNSLQAYMAMAQDCPDIGIPIIRRKDNGCRITGFFAIPEEDTGYPAPELLSLVFNEVTSRIGNWRDEAGKEFDYIWFDVDDFESIEIIKRMGHMEVQEKIVYKMLNNSVWRERRKQLLKKLS